MEMIKNNNFSIEVARDFLRQALEQGYEFVTMSEYATKQKKDKKYFIARLDLDIKPATLQPFVKLASELSIPFTVFVRVAGPYNVFWYPHFQMISEASSAGCEIGLHTTPVEWATIMGREIESTLSAELLALRSHFDVVGVAPHRDINYTYNSLPWLDKHWEHLKTSMGLLYHAYESVFHDDMLYVNEGLSPHLGWRGIKPMEAIKTGKNIHMLLHPHWWYVKHPFEAE
jgi:hypothetical protein